MTIVAPSHRSRLVENLWRRLTGSTTSLILAGLFMAALSAGALLPQLPLHLSANLSERTRWLATTSFAYGDWGTLLRDLGLFDVAHTIWWRTLLALALFHALLHLAESTERIWRLLIPRPSSLPTYRQAVHLTPGETEERLARVWQQLPARGYSQRGEAREGNAILWRAVHRRWIAWGTAMAWLGILLLLTWELLGEKGAWRMANLSLPPGEAVPLGQSDGLSLQLSEDGAASPEEVIFLKGDETAARRPLSFGQPASYAGIGVHWLGTGSALRVQGQDASGAPVDFQSLSEDGPSSRHLHLLFDDGGERTFGVPALGLGFRVVAAEDGAYTVEVYRSSESDPILQERITGEGNITVEGAHYTFSPVSFVRVTVEHSPFFPLLTIGGILAVVGLSLHLWLPSRALWLRAAQVGETTWVEWTADGEATDSWLRQTLGTEEEGG